MALYRALPAALLLITAPTAAQKLLWTIPSDAPFVPPIVSGGGDLDDDGRNDFIVQQAGVNQVHSGADASVVLLQFGSSGFSGSLDSLSDFDGDGIEDYVGTGFAFLEVYSGASAALLYSGFVPCPGAILVGVGYGRGIGDLDGDGLEEVILNEVELSFPEEGGWDVRYGPDGSQNQTVPCSSCELESVLIADGVGDVTGDGVPDIAMAVQGQPACVSAFELRILSGATFQVVCQRSIGLAPVRGQLRGVGDVNGDGVGDVFAVTGMGGVRRPIVYSGTDLDELMVFAPTSSFSALAGPGDVDCDGVPDLLIGEPDDSTAGVDAGRVRLLSGADGSQLQVVFGSAGDELGADVAAVGDVDGDGVPDWITSKLGAALVYAGIGPAAVSYCTGKVTSAGCVPVTDSAGTPSIGGASGFLVLARNTLASRPGLFFFGSNGASALPFLGGTLCVQPPLVRTPVQLSSPGVDCEAGYSFAFDPALALQQNFEPGDATNGQFWMRDPAQADGTGVALSDGLRFIWCP